MVYKLFYKKTSGGATTLANKSAVKMKLFQKKELVELQKPILEKSRK